MSARPPIRAAHVRAARRPTPLTATPTRMRLLRVVTLAAAFAASAPSAGAQTPTVLNFEAVPTAAARAWVRMVIGSVT